MSVPVAGVLKTFKYLSLIYHSVLKVKTDVHTLFSDLLMVGSGKFESLYFPEIYVLYVLLMWLLRNQCRNSTESYFRVILNLNLFHIARNEARDIRIIRGNRENYFAELFFGTLPMHEGHPMVRNHLPPKDYLSFF